MRHLTIALTLSVATCLALAPSGCSDTPRQTDGGVDDLRPVADGGAVADVTAPAWPCNPALALDPLVLAADYCASVRLELTAPPSAIALQGGALWLFNGGVDGASFAGTVERRALDAQGQPGVATPFFSLAMPATSKVFTGEYLALDPGGTMAAVGYTLEQTFDGAVFWGAAQATPQRVAGAQGNYDAVLLDEKTLLVNGLGLGSAQSGQGVYVVAEGQIPRLLIKELGTLSGHLVRGESVLYAGGYFSEGSKIYGFTLAEVRAAIAAGQELSAVTDGDLIYAGNSLDAAALGDDLVLARTDAAFTFEAVSLIPVTVSGGALSAGEATDLVTGSAAVGRLVAAGTRLGLMEMGGKVLTLIQRK